VVSVLCVSGLRVILAFEGVSSMMRRQSTALLRGDAQGEDSERVLFRPFPLTFRGGGQDEHPSYISIPDALYCPPNRKHAPKK
jgi:hypothetical protein